MAREHIYDKDIRYSILRRIWTDGPIKSSFRKLEVIGMDKLPKDGALILCPNHCNTLMDALVILGSYEGPTVFGARADIFRKPLFAKALTFLRILPMVRQRDGIRNVLQNNKTQEVIVDTLEHGVKFCIFPEGSHRTKHSIQRLGKGAFRIALAANEKFGQEKPVYLVPVGIEYGDYFRFRGTVIANYGEAINVTEFIRNGNFESEPHIIEGLRVELEKRMSELITYIKVDDDYEAKWALTKMCALRKSHKCYGDCCTKLYDSMQKNREIVKGIEDTAEKKPEQMAEILERVNTFEAKRKKAGVSIFSFRKMKPTLNAIGKGFAALLGLPYFIFSAITTLPMWAIAGKIKSGVKDPAFGNTVTFALKLALGPVLFTLYTILAFCLAPWWLATILILLYLPTYGYFHDYLEGCRRWFSDIRLLKTKGLYKEFKHIVKDYLNLQK